MGELRQSARFLYEALAEVVVLGRLLVEDLDRDLATERLILGQIDLGGAAGSERLQDAVPLVQDPFDDLLPTSAPMPGIVRS
jgi:hypothetical protein